jgi:hypothetical protein
MATLVQEKVALEQLSEMMLLSKTAKHEQKLVVEGDSWFDYPLTKDIIDHLRKMGYAIKRHSKHGDTLENMVFGNEYSIRGNAAINNGNRSLQEVLTSIRIYNPRFVLFSAGGNDVVGSEFEQYLNHKNSGLQLFKDANFNQNLIVMKNAIEKFLTHIWEINPGIDILMDGYDYAKPNGTTYLGISGPWVLPGFAKKNILNRKTEQEPIIKKLVDGFNGILNELDTTYDRFHHIDLRGIFPDDSMWDNEIHLKSQGYRKMEEIAGFNPVV